VGSPSGAVVTSLRHVLLLVQSAVCGLVALGTSVFALAGHSPQLGLLAAVAGMLALVPVVVAAGLCAGCGWARGLGIGYELLLLVSGVTDALVLRNDDVVATVVNVVFPAVLIWLLLRRQPTMRPWSGVASQVGSTRS